MTSVDSDLRTMALMDLHKELLRITTPATLASTSSSSTTRRAVDSGYTEEHTEKELTLQVLKLLVDPIGEVKNQAVAWYVYTRHLLFTRGNADDLLAVSALWSDEHGQSMSR